METAFRKVDVPEGVSGVWSVSRFEVTKEEAQLHNLRCMMHRNGRSIKPGSYTKLMCSGQLVMSDTPAECKDHLRPYFEAKRRGGHCLVNGLGLGVVVQALSGLDNVEKITVVEVSADVIKLVANHYCSRYPGRIEVVEGDAYKWKPPKGLKYSVVWHDIWSSICVDNLSGMGTLHRRYGRRCNWQGSWCRHLCER